MNIKRVSGKDAINRVSLILANKYSSWIFVKGLLDVIPTRFTCKQQTIFSSL